MPSALEQLSAFKSKLNAAIDISLETEVADLVKEEMTNQIISNVYDIYTPSMYIRRFSNGGLIDPQNMISRVEDNHTLVVQNVTGDTDHMYGISTENNHGGDVVEAVESGTGYNWKHSQIYAKQPFPRPFHKPTEKAVISESTAKKALLIGLKNQGFNVNL